MPLQGEEKYRTEGFKEIALIYGTAEESFRKTAALVNHIRHQEEGGTPFRTMRETTEREGMLLQEHLEEKVSSILIFPFHEFSQDLCGFAPRRS